MRQPFIVGMPVSGGPDLSEEFACCSTEGLGCGVTTRDDHRPSGQVVGDHEERSARHLQGVRRDADEGPRGVVVCAVGIHPNVVKCSVVYHRLEGFWEILWDDGEGTAVFV